MIVLEMLLKGVLFDSQSIWELPFNHNRIGRTFRALIDAGVIRKSPIRGKYRLTNGFLDAMKQDITERMPRGVFLHYPDLTIFDISGIGSWTEEELERYVRRLKERWLLRRKQLGDARGRLGPELDVFSASESKSRSDIFSASGSSSQPSSNA